MLLAAPETDSAPVLDAAAQQIRLDTVMLDLLDRGRALPFGRFAAGTEFNYRFSGLLEVNRLASLRTLESIRTGDIDVATKSLLDRVALLRAFDESQGEIAVASKALLVRGLSTDVGILVGASPSDENLRALSQALEAIYAEPGAGVRCSLQIRSRTER